MNRRRHLTHVMGVGVAAAVLAACAAPIASTPTAQMATVVVTVSPPTTRPTRPPATATVATPARRTTAPPTATDLPTEMPIVQLSSSPALIPVDQKPLRATSFPGNVVYTLPDMDDVLLASELPYAGALSVDLYYPSGYDFKTPRPVVILSHGFVEATEFDKDIPSHIDWAKLIAASGMIAVSAQAGQEPTTAALALIDYLAVNAKLLGLDLSRIGFWACSAQGEPTFKTLETSGLVVRDGFRAAVFTYVDFTAADPAAWPTGMSLMVVKAGKDEYISGDSIDQFVKTAEAAGLQVDFVELPDALHAFDIRQDTTFSKETVAQALTFLKTALLPID